MTNWGPHQRGLPSHSGGQNSTLKVILGPQPPGGAGEDPSNHLWPSAAPCSWVCGCTPLPTASTAAWLVSVWLCPAMHLHARTLVVLDSGPTLTQQGTVLTLFQLQRFHFQQSHTLTFPGTLFGCPVASKLSLCRTDVLHRSRSGAPACSHASSSGPSTPEARGHRGKDMAPWPHESHWGAGEPSQASSASRPVLGPEESTLLWRSAWQLDGGN
ncbi:Fanconi anemia core complex-associated protein 20 isoform X2 [Moschus berezovskii]|uniref:Fanconi anemia core complex-associated protein 20 isoform X2 n=1 Tax=Moschus berezovskii TaxID=68408 RepID=UPI0024448F04|nr:Fanconi anemia core complex-associated protein 20 isoform X2 [Moschus berezovskii]